LRSGADLTLRAGAGAAPLSAIIGIKVTTVSEATLYTALALWSTLILALLGAEIVRAGLSLSAEMDWPPIQAGILIKSSTLQDPVGVLSAANRSL